MCFNVFPPPERLRLVVEVTRFFAYVGNDIFFIITGYYLSKAKFKSIKIPSLFFHVLVINILQLAVEVFVFEEKNLSSVVAHIFPISSGVSWFFSAYFGIYFIFPILQKFIFFLNDNMKLYRYIVAVLFFINSLVGFFTPSNFFYSGFYWGIVCIIFGNYLAEINKKRSLNNTILCLFMVITLMGAIISTMFLIYVSNYIAPISTFISHFITNSSPFVLFFAIACFNLFQKIKIRSRVINYFASCILSIYLWHSNTVFSGILWRKILCVQNYMQIMPMYLILCVFVIFFVGVIIDLIYKNTIQRCVEKILSRYCTKIDNFIKTL